MAKHIFKCSGCGSYTMKEVHDCGSKAFSTRPPKFSPEDKYGRYRRETKAGELKEKGLL